MSVKIVIGNGLDKPYIYTFSNISKKLLNTCGNKAVNLAELYNNKFPVPEGFVLSSTFVTHVLGKKIYPSNFKQELTEAIKDLEIRTKKKFGDKDNPLLVSVRSSGNVSMPGVLESILNVGMNKALLNDWNVAEDFKEDLYVKNRVRVVEDPIEQLMYAIDLVINSIYEEKFQYYDLSDNLRKNFTMGIIVQQMVFGNLNNNSYTGVVFTSLKHNNEIQGEILIKSQGDDLVNGKITPIDVKKLPTPIYLKLSTFCKKIEAYFKYIQDVEFTVENGELYLLQTRNAQLTVLEKFQMWENFVKQSLITKEEFFLLTPPLNQVRNKQIKYDRTREVVGQGIGITENVIFGYLANNHDLVLKLHQENKPVIYVTEETNSNHMKSIVLASGLITAKGGATSHAAIVARGRNIVCLLSLQHLEILSNGIKIGNNFFENKTLMTLDGNRGYLLKGQVEMEEVIEETESIKWKLSPIEVKINGETVKDMVNGQKFLMDGVGLCRIEHMLLMDEGNTLIKQFLLNTHNKNLEMELEKYLTQSFKALFASLGNFPINIRLLDPPLHEFLPVQELKEVNPMLGNRGVRVLLSNHQLFVIQIRAIFNAYINSKVHLEIMIPFVFSLEELLYVKNIIREVHNKDYAYIAYKFGVMIELPRAVFIADKLAKEVDFIAFGTNDLTQMVFGLSRDDSGPIIQNYMSKGILSYDPFQKLDPVICELLEIGVKKARSVKPDIVIGICGEQGANEESIEFLTSIGINYISCSPFRIEQVRFNLNRYFSTQSLK